MSWFEDTFLPSLFERCGLETRWLTRKQTAVCLDHMERHTARIAQFQGDYTAHDYFTLDWRGRKITLQYSKLNGCGTITFGMNAEEQAEAGRKAQEERERLHLERMERRLRRHPEQFMHDLEQARRRLEYWREELRMDEEDGLEDDAARDRELIAEALEEMKKMEAMMAAG